MKKAMIPVVLMSFALVCTACAEVKPVGRYYFGKGMAPSGYKHVSSKTEYTKSRGYGWLKEFPNQFAAQLPEGNYDVSIAFESPEAATATTVKAESRRLMLKSGDRSNGKTRRFTLNIRRPEIQGRDHVHLNSRETNPLSPEWDDLLTLEFLPGATKIEGITITPAPDAVTVYIAGDSTVTDQREEPWCGWGQMLPRFFKPGIAVANHAESGRALFSFLWEKRLDKILSTIKPGDYLLIQFGHNDQKDKRKGAGPFTTYTKELKEYIAKVRAKKAYPVMVTPMERRRWRGGRPYETLTDYAEAMRQVGKEEHVPVIDLHAMSLKFYAALGEEGSRRAFVQYPAHTFPGQDKALKDETHHNAFGAYELARCVVKGIKTQVPDLAKHLQANTGSFDPSHPDDPDHLGIPASLAASTEKPEGN